MSVEESWERIVAWCRAHAPATAAVIRPPAEAGRIAETERATGGRWPVDLRDWYRLADGTERTPADCLLPFYNPLPVEIVAAEWASWQRDQARITAAARSATAGTMAAALGGRPEDPYDVDRHEREPAGTAAGMFLPSFVPIAEDQSGSYLFVDTRPGPLHGCVTEFVKGNADSDGPRWPSVTAMLTEVADALDRDLTVGGWRPVVDNASLTWTFEMRHPA